jgi:hypothetical protein
MLVRARMLNTANPSIDFMQPMQLVNASSGLAYADDINSSHRLPPLRTYFFDRVSINLPTSGDIPTSCLLEPRCLNSTI